MSVAIPYFMEKITSCVFHSNNSDRAHAHISKVISYILGRQSIIANTEFKEAAS